ncbi:Hypothetical protein D9617_2g059380 [Elsinoe fawcettii]|nr:Hypothetical protein D9617_2g059380 [Elsinoe fawcettii]
MYSPQPVSKKPPGVLDYTTTDSRDHSQHSIPSFQSFLKRTPPPQDSHKPLPPDPPADVSTARNDSRSRRRSSSAYSRLINQWAATPESRTDSDPFPSSPTATSHTSQHDVYDGEILQPTVFRPEGQKARNGHDSGVQISPGKSDHTSSVKTSDEDKTMSLEEARERASKPSAAPLLPEEWRAKTASNQSLHLYGSDSSFHKQAFDDDQSAKTPGSVRFDLHSTSYAKQKPMNMPSASVSEPYLKYAEAYRQNSDASILTYEPRGRTTERQVSAPHTPTRYGPPSEAESTAPRVPSEAERLAHMYHAVLRDQSLQSSRNSSTYSRSDGSDTRTRMKLVPQPLFFNPRTISEQRAKKYCAPRFNSSSPRSTDRRGILKNASPVPMLNQEVRSKKAVHSIITPVSSRQANTGISDISPRSDKSDTPILGRFASAPKARSKSPHLHSPTKIAHSSSGTFAAMKDMVSSLPSRRLSLHMPAAVKNVHVDTDKMKETLVKVGGMLESKEKKREKEREKRKLELKRIIRVIPNA